MSTFVQNPPPESVRPEAVSSANMQQLEDCDLCDDADAYRTLVRFAGDSLTPTHTVDFLLYLI